MLPDEQAKSISEYDDNPFIAKLPPIQTRLQMLDMLRNLPSFDPLERNFEAHIRKHCVLRLSRYFEPLDRHIQFCEKFDMLLRQGYISRNPLTHDYLLRLQNTHDREALKNSGAKPLVAFVSFASTFALIGASGSGKSILSSRVFAHYPQVITHTNPFPVSQIVWIRLDCPSQGSLTQLCRNFFYAVDLLLGTKYQAKYGGKHRSLDEMLLDMGHIANLHAIGALLIDEIQFLGNFKRDSEALLRFFVTLVNTIGIPVILIGTNSVLPLLQENFKEARRANGLGSMIWDPLENNTNWKHLVTQLWKYQWTSTYTELNDEFVNVLYEETQGIIDILIKLFMLVQMRIISVREATKGPEVITVGLIRKVAHDDFKMVRPMLNALKAKDMKALRRYDDLLPFQSHFDNLISESQQGYPITAYVPPIPLPLGDRQDDLRSQLMAVLVNSEIAEDIGVRMIDDALRKHPSGDYFMLMQDLIQVISAAKASKPKKAKLIRQPLEEMDAGDLRHIVEHFEGESSYAKLLKGGVIRFPLQDVAA